MWVFVLPWVARRSVLGEICRDWLGKRWPALVVVFCRVGRLCWSVPRDGVAEGGTGRLAGLGRSMSVGERYPVCGFRGWPHGRCGGARPLVRGIKHKGTRDGGGGCSSRDGQVMVQHRGSMRAIVASRACPLGPARGTYREHAADDTLLTPCRLSGPMCRRHEEPTASALLATASCGLTECRKPFLTLVPVLNHSPSGPCSIASDLTRVCPHRPRVARDGGFQGWTGVPQMPGSIGGIRWGMTGA